MPKSISDHLGVDAALFAATGAFDAILDVDSLLFIDPHLLSASSAPEIAASHETVKDRFRKILKTLSCSSAEGDPFWNSAVKLFTFPELKGLCIGYSGKGTAGSGMGPALRLQILRTAKTIIDAGISDPEFFELVGVFEENVGPDRISDMIGRIIIEDLLTYTERILRELQVATKPFEYNGKPFELVLNPYNNSPVILLPQDILRDLPVAHDWSDIDLVCAHNENLRMKVNALIGDTWKQATSEKKDHLKKVMLGEPDLVRDLLDLYKNKPALRYDFENDPAGEIVWYKTAQRYASAFPLQVRLSSQPKSEEVLGVVTTICNKFKDLIENNALSSLLYDDKGRPKHESAAQKLFYGIADAYCEANNLDLSREANAGRGPVDFKISGGYSSRVVVEAKLTTNAQLIHGLTVQIEEYQKAEKTNEAIYLVIDNGGPPKRKSDLIALLASRRVAGDQVPTVIFIDGVPKASASVFDPEKHAQESENVDSGDS